MQCPKCQEAHLKVTNIKTGLVTTRIRKCTNCGHSLHTVESIKYDNYSKAYAREMIELGEIKT